VEQTGPHPGEEAWNERYAVADVDPGDTRSWSDYQQSAALSRIHGFHRRFARRFAMRLDFGAARMGEGFYDPARTLAETETVIPTFPQPRDGEMWADGWLVDDPPPDDDVAAALASWHRERGIDVVNDGGWGLLATGAGEAEGWQYGVELPEGADPADAPFLIGFRPHATQSPADQPLAPAWRLDRIELIGLLLHDEPVAYASNALPRIGETATHATRPLTAFEKHALPRLAEGEWVVAAADRYRLRAVGALPAAKACAECHNVARGTLLGALSYDFTRSSNGRGEDAEVNSNDAAANDAEAGVRE
jgi:hypothetical protein